MRILLIVLHRAGPGRGAVAVAAGATSANGAHPGDGSTCPTRKPATTGARASTGRASIASLKWNGHEYFGQWFERYDPKIHDAITGPVEEFLTGDAGLGYDEAKAGRDVRADRRRRRAQAGRAGVPPLRDLRHRRPRQVVGQEVARTGSSSSHELGDTGGYAYVYRKTLRLSAKTRWCSNIA